MKGPWPNESFFLFRDRLTCNQPNRASRGSSRNTPKTRTCASFDSWLCCCSLLNAKFITGISYLTWPLLQAIQANFQSSHCAARCLPLPAAAARSTSDISTACLSTQAAQHSNQQSARRVLFVVFIVQKFFGKKMAK